VKGEKMGIISAVAKVAKSAIKAVSGKGATKAISNVKRAVKAAPDFIFGTGSDVGAKAMKATKGSIFTKMKAGAKAIVKDSEKASAKGGGFFKRLFNGLKSTPSSIAQGAKVGSRAAKIAGKSSFWGGVKGVFKSIGKKMPLIGSALCVAFEIPNIWSAAKDEGIGTALKETGKAVVRLAGGAAGATLGTFLGGPIGGIAGFAAGEWLLGKLTGDSYSDKKDFLAEQDIDDDTLKQLKEQGYSFDDIYKQVKVELKVVEAQQELEATTQETQPAGQTPAADQPVEEQPVAEQPAQPISQVPAENPVGVTPGVEPVPVRYSEEEVVLLKQLGLSDDDIQLLQNAGYSINDALALINNIKNQGNTPISDLTKPAGGTTDTDSDYLEPFVLPYPMATGSAYQQPGSYNPGLYSNPYTMDTYYNLLLNDLGMQYNNNMTNPFGAGNTQNYGNISQNQYDNPYYKNGRLGFSA